MAKISVIGSGGWGTAMAIMLSKNGHQITVWSFREEEKEELIKTRENKSYLPGVIIPDDIKITTDFNDCKGSDLVIIATPSHGVRNVAKMFSKFAEKDLIVLNISKGIEEGTYLTLSKVLKEELPQCKIAVMSGPSHAEEVAKEIPTTNVVASDDIRVSEYIQSILTNPYFRIYTNVDMIGVEIGGSLKNVYALCCGIIDGMGLGDNTKAALMTRALYEMTKLGAKMGADIQTFYGLSGVGDLIVTCTSMHSRNKRAGILIGQGKTCKEATEEVKMVVEGVKTCKAAKELSDKLGVELPIVNEAYNVLFNNGDLSLVIKNLMERKVKDESYYN